MTYASTYVKTDQITDEDRFDFVATKIQLWKDELIANYIRLFDCNIPQKILIENSIFHIERYLSNNYKFTNEGIILFDSVVADQKISKRLHKIFNLPYSKPTTELQRKYNKFVQWMDSTSQEKRYFVTLQNEKVFSYDESKEVLDRKLDSFRRVYLKYPIAFFSEIGKKEGLYHYHIIINHLDDVKQLKKFAKKHGLKVHADRIHDGIYLYNRLFNYARKSKNFYSYRT